MADTATITANVVDGSAITSSVTSGSTVTTSVSTTATVTSNLIAGGAGPAGATGAAGAAGQGVPTGGTAGQILSKIDSTNYNTQWTTASGTGDALVANPLSQFASTTSLQLKGVMSDETGSGALVFGTSPAITTPTGIVKGDVGLGSVDNTSDATKNAAAVTLTNKTITSPSIGGTTTLTGMTAGSVLYSGASSVLSQDNASFFWDTSVKQLRLGTGSTVFDGDDHYPLRAAKNTNNYYGPVVQNLSSGDTASADFLVSADNDTTAIAGHYGDFGIQGSGFVAAGNGVIKTVSINAAGTGYTANDIVNNVANGDGNAQIKILTVNVGGGATSVSIFDNGTGYSVASGLATTGGTGSGFTFNVLSLFSYTGLSANDIYLLGVGGNLVLASDDTVAGKVIKLLVGGFATANEVGRFTATGLTVGLAGTTKGIVTFSGNTSGTTLLQPAAAASGTLTLPAATDTLVGLATTDTLTNKNISSATNTYRAASDTATGAVELATAAETTTGTDATRSVTPDGLAGSDYGKRVIGLQVFASGVNTATGDAKAFFRVPSVMNGWTIVAVAANVYTAGTTGTTDIQIRNKTDSVDVLSTKLTIDSTETDSSTAATAAVINAANDDLATGDLIAIDVDAVSTTPAVGLFVEIQVQAP